MENISCSYERLIVASARSGALDPSVQDHLSHCPGCRQILQVARFLNGLAQESGELPEASILWQKAQLGLARQTAREVTRPIRIFQLAVCLMAATALLGWGIWEYPWVWRLQSYTLATVLLHLCGVFLISASAASIGWALSDALGEF